MDEKPDDATTPATRVARFMTGIVGAGLVETDIEIPIAEPPPLPLNEKLAVVGKPTPRLDGRAKVTGAARYTADVRLPGMLFARMVCSPHPHARVRSIDTSAAERHSGVRAVHVLERVLGGAEVTDKSRELPSRYPIVRFAGQPVAAVAAVTEAAALEAVRLVRVDYEPLPFVVDEVKAREPGAPRVFPAPADMPISGGGGGAAVGLPQNGNVRGPERAGWFGAARGDVTKGFAEADVVVEGEFRTQVQTHSALETHGVVADWKADGLTVYASTQGTASVRDELSVIFGLKKSQVRVITEFMGGGFGAKFGAGNAGVFATHLSKKAGAPVRLMLDRKEEHLWGGNRSSSMQTLRIGAKRDGALTAIHLVNYGTAGVGTGAGVGTAAENMYVCPNQLSQEYDVFINAGPAWSFRAPGHPQGCFALEQLIDDLAERIGVDALALRDRVDASPIRRVERRVGAEKFGWARRRPPGSDPGPVKRGMGFAQALWYRLTDMDSAVEVRVTRDGSVELLSGVQDIGSGIRTVLAQVVAEELGLTPADVDVKIGDTAFPNGPGSGGSVTTNSITPPARNAAWAVRRRILAGVAPHFGVAPDALEMRGGKVFAPADPSKEMTFRQACQRLKTEQIAERSARSANYPGGDPKGTPDYSGGVQFAEVAVDTETGVVKVERVVAVYDCGRPINPLGVVSQVNGGIIQGISYALYENRILDRTTGHMVNPNFEQYKIAGSREIPEIEVHLIEEYRGRSSTDAGGIAEPTTIPPAAAIANAVYNATGARVRELPMTPACVLAALARAKRGGEET
jgi:xanthine dehydrogenase YagR molybdenum-binding subunit